MSDSEKLVNDGALQKALDLIDATRRDDSIQYVVLSFHASGLTECLARRMLDTDVDAALRNYIESPVLESQFIPRNTQ